ncbi:MDR family MFS transporter [Paenibacillus aceris]|uniref:MFS family permease n=1 Tax=Paenibacillus aceris TaxID=869555 RepID=A0ABS4I8C7_9BACL|nr:MFS transporter [Paenibacillus aceris]MBP1967184.1 MFS family permease [Paenibacillus aceris]NHW35580.1 MFS transporter [Paenibacillus aceris]
MKTLKFHPVAWAVIIGTFLSRTGFYMTIPFLAIYLGKVKGIDPATIGAILAVSLFVGTGSSFIGGALSDRLGRYPVLISSMAAWSLVFVGFAFAENTSLFFLLSALNGLFRSVFEPTARALLADVTSEERRSDAFNARYFAINIGGSVGPLVGLKLGAGGLSSLLPFMVSAGIFAVYAIALIIFMLLYKLEPQETSDLVSMKKTVSIVFKDKVFIYFLLGNVFVAGAYSHLDSTLSQFIGHNRLGVYSFLFVINTLTVVIIQYPLTRLMKRFSSLTSLKVGCLLFGLGILGFGLFENVYMLVLFMVIFTTGEILCYVIGDVLIGEIAPAHLRGAYYGAGGFMIIGQSAGTWIGGILLSILGFGQGPIIFSILMLLAFMAFPFFHRGQKLRENQQRAANTRGGSIGMKVEEIHNFS